MSPRDPICFSIFINDLPYAVKVDVVLFAGDAAFIVTSGTFDILMAKIRELSEDLSHYLRTNQLVPNSNKSKLMIFKSLTLPELPDVSFFGQKIECVLDFEYLGVTITNNMSFSIHINNITNKVSQITGTFLSPKKYCSNKYLNKIILCPSLSSSKCQCYNLGLSTCLSHLSTESKTE